MSQVYELSSIPLYQLLQLFQHCVLTFNFILSEKLIETVIILFSKNYNFIIILIKILSVIWKISKVYSKCVLL